MINRLQKRLDEKKTTREQLNKQILDTEHSVKLWREEVALLDVEIELLTNHIQKMKESES